MMAGMAVITKDTTVFDPCCGTGGFLIAAATAAQKAGGETWEDTVKVMAENGRLLGIEKVEYTAGLCVVNMVRPSRGVCACAAHLAQGFPLPVWRLQGPASVRGDS